MNRNEFRSWWEKLTPRQKDAEVAERVMGYGRWTCGTLAGLWPPDAGPTPPWRQCGREVPLAPAGYAHAMPFVSGGHSFLDVVRKLRGDGWRVSLESCDTHGWFASIFCENGPCERHGSLIEDWHGILEIPGRTMAEAVCKAAMMLAVCGSNLREAS